MRVYRKINHHRTIPDPDHASSHLQLSLFLSLSLVNSGKLIKFLSFVRATGMNERGGMKNGGGPTSLATGVKLTLLLTRGEARSLFLFDLLLLLHERNTRLVANLSNFGFI